MLVQCRKGNITGIEYKKRLMLESYFMSLGPAVGKGGRSNCGVGFLYVYVGISDQVGAGHAKPWRVCREYSG